MLKMQLWQKKNKLYTDTLCLMLDFKDVTVLRITFKLTISLLMINYHDTCKTHILHFYNNSGKHPKSKHKMCCAHFMLFCRNDFLFLHTQEQKKNPYHRYAEILIPYKDFLKDFSLFLIQHP